MSSRNVTRRRFLEQAGGIAALGMMPPLLPFWSQAPAGGLPKPGDGDWPIFGHDLHNTRFNDKETIIGLNNVERLKVKWQFDTADNFTIHQTPAVVGDTLFFGAGRYEYSLDSATGKQKWRNDWGADGEWERTAWQEAAKNRGTRVSPQYVDGRIYFNTGSVTAFCVDAATGKTIWKNRLLDDERLEHMEAQSWYNALVYKGKMFTSYSGGDATLYCLDTETGAIRWQFRIGQDAPADFRTGGGSPWAGGAIDEAQNIVFTVTGSNKGFMPNLNLYTESIIANDIDTGELIWYYQAHPQDAHDLDFVAHPMIFDAVSPPRFRGDVRACVAAGNKAGIYCWNRHTGELYWKTMLGQGCASCGPRVNSIAVAYNHVFVQNENAIGNPPMSVTAALHAYTGAIAWIVPNPVMNPQAPIAVANGVLYQGLADGRIEALDASNGRRLWEYKLPSMPRGGFAIANGAIYTSNGEPTSWKEGPLPYQHSMYCFTIDGK